MLYQLSCLEVYVSSMISVGISRRPQLTTHLLFLQVKKPHTPLLKPKAYADNFKWKGPAQN
ncbi:hypothetical protein BT93_L3935 [Corymbia citriodora subsp. variegata]|uniref:Uncharacterized protein n=1 Tax=Corymbia citriodora subsp. variegata TaxID=360336 RepID=A0A8T0CUZ7_CORYI|nr:hypothetical protein BT93_L3935 [Corymbia citriodora subsp. variegata]